MSSEKKVCSKCGRNWYSGDTLSLSDVKGVCPQCIADERKNRHKGEPSGISKLFASIFGAFFGKKA